MNGHVTDNLLLVLAIVLSVSVFVAGLLTFGVYFVWIFGGARIWRAVLFVIEVAWFYAQHFIFRVLMFLHLYHAWCWVVNKLPFEYGSLYRQKKFRMMRNVVLRRRQYRSWVARKVRRQAVRRLARKRG